MVPNQRSQVRSRSIVVSHTYMAFFVSLIPVAYMHVTKLTVGCWPRQVMILAHATTVGTVSSRHPSQCFSSTAQPRSIRLDLL